MQRALLLSIVLACVISGFVLTKWASTPNMRLLYQQLAPEDAAKITEKLSEKNIAYELRSGGTAIFVPEDSVYQLRLDMAKEGLPTGGQGGYKIFDNEKIGISPFVQSVNLNRALQDELAQTIQMIEGVVYARVHLVRPEQALFGSSGDKTTASVVLKLRPGLSLSQANIAAISHLVAGSVEGLKSENVTVVDSTGKLLSNKADNSLASGANTILEYKQQVEQALEKKAQEMLEQVLGPGHATVSVAAAIDMTAGNQTKETYDPTTKIATKEEIKNKSEVGAVAASADASKPAGAGPTTKDETITTEYVVGKITEQKTDMPGRIVSLSVSAVVDLTPANADPNKPAVAAMTVQDVEEIIRNAVGLKTTDSLKVVNTRFHQPAAVVADVDTEYQQSVKWNRYIELARQLSLGILAISALLVLKIFAGFKKSAPADAVGAFAASAPNAGLLASGEGEPLALRGQITNALQSNPDEVKRLFTSWAQDRGE